MNRASNLCYLKKPAQKAQQQQQPQQQGLFGMQQVQRQASDDEDDVDTNVISLNFDFLKNAQKNIALGDPIECKKCKGLLNTFSVILNQQQYLAKQEESKSNEYITLELNNNQRFWLCEFCAEKNIITVDEEEIPKKDDMIYIIESAQQKGANNEKSDVSIVFCLDTSGSMSVTQEVKGQAMNLKHGISAEEYEMLKQFIDPGDEHQMFPGQNKNVTFVSRKQCVFAAVEEQIDSMAQSHPQRKVGIVTFNDDVTVLGDGSLQEPLILTGDRLFKYDEIFKLSEDATVKLMSQPIQNSFNGLKQKLNAQNANGQTALGPALLSSLALASKGKPGSVVVLCTDGLANKGLGSMDQDQDFYDKISKIAVDNGVIINVITIKGEGCKLDVLGKVVEASQGTVTRIAPDEVGKNFSAMLKDEIVGTKVELHVQLHKALKFRNEDEGIVAADGSSFVRMIGNATIKTKISFEYEKKADEELQAVQIDITALKEVPFQAKIYYTTQEGHRYLRVLTQMQKTTEDKRVAEQQIEKMEVMHQRVVQKSSAMVQHGNYQKAQNYNKNWGGYMQQSVFNQDSEQVAMNSNFMHQQQKVNKVSNKMQKKQQRFEANDDCEEDLECIQEESVQRGGGGGGGKPVGTVASKRKADVKDVKNVKEKEKKSGGGIFGNWFGSSSSSQSKKKESEKIEKEACSSSDDEDKDAALILNFKQGKY